MHKYFPEWFLLVSKLRLSPSATTTPSFFHVICGVGFPVALQWNVALAPSITLWSSGVVIRLGGTEINKYLYVINVQFWYTFFTESHLLVREMCEVYCYQKIGTTGYLLPQAHVFRFCLTAPFLGTAAFCPINSLLRKNTWNPCTNNKLVSWISKLLFPFISLFLYSHCTSR